MILPMSITHTNLVLIPKKDKVASLLNFRSISFSNFMNKVISRIVHIGLKDIYLILSQVTNPILLKGEVY